MPNRNRTKRSIKEMIMKKIIAVLLLLALCNGAYVCANPEIATKQLSSKDREYLFYKGIPWMYYAGVNPEFATKQPSSQSPEYLFYKSNPWVYMEKILCCTQEENKEFISLKTSIIIASLIVFLGLNSNLNGKLKVEHFAIAGCFLLACVLVSIIMMSSIDVFCDYLQTSQDKSILRSFLQNYDPNLVPEELRQTCQALVEWYKCGGEEYLKKDGLRVLSLLRELINEKKKLPLRAIGDQLTPLLMCRWPDDVQK
jgi:hypothetical protein